MSSVRGSRIGRGVCMVSSAVAVLAGPSSAMADPVIVAAGDVACPNRPCDSHRQTARLIGRIGPRAVLALGDNQYDDGALVDYKASYDPTWGRFKGRTHPTPGNHEYHTPGADGYFDYFGARAARVRRHVQLHHRALAPGLDQLRPRHHLGPAAPTGPAQPPDGPPPMRACVLAPPALVLGNPARIERIDGAPLEGAVSAWCGRRAEWSRAQLRALRVDEPSRQAGTTCRDPGVRRRDGWARPL